MFRIFNFGIDTDTTATDPDRDLPADPLLGVSAVGLFHRLRWGAASDLGRLSRRVAAETALLAVLRRRFPPDGDPVPLGEILDLGAQVAALDPDELYWAGRELLAKRTLPPDWPRRLPDPRILPWRNTRDLGLPRDWLARLIAPGGLPAPPGTGQFYAPEPLHYELLHFPLEADDDRTIAEELPDEGAALGIALAWAHAVLAAPERPHTLASWREHWSRQSNAFDKLCAIGSMRNFLNAAPIDGEFLLAVAAAGVSLDVRLPTMFPRAPFRVPFEPARQMLAERPDAIVADMRRVLVHWHHVAPDLWMARPWGPPGPRLAMTIMLPGGHKGVYRPPFQELTDESRARYLDRRVGLWAFLRRG